MIPYFYTLQNDHNNESGYHLSPYKVITILLTIFSRLYITSPGLMYFISGNLSGLMCHLRPVFLHCFFCLDDLSIEIRGVLKSLTITVLLSISPFMFVNICFMYLGAPMSGAYILRIVISSC